MSNDDSAEQRQQVLMSLSDRPQQFRQNQFQVLVNQCRRARDAEDDGGPSYLSMPF